MLGSQFPEIVLYENSGLHAFNSANNFDSIAFLSSPWQQIILSLCYLLESFSSFCVFHYANFLFLFLMFFIILPFFMIYFCYTLAFARQNIRSHFRELISQHTVTIDSFEQYSLPFKVYKN